ncbi:MAG: IMP dehydrogenase [Planctomycetes bacterium]|nr:IMP dehydrogenase [Planctomycetota bacterium]
MQDRIVGEAITFDDVLLVPTYSEVVGSDVDVTSQATRRVGLKIPIVSAAMDTVTESALAISLAQQGGIGIIHKNVTIDRQVKEVYLVKRSVNGIIYDPITLPPNEKVATARRLMEENKISGIPIVEGRRVVGILTSRDLRFRRDENARIADVMTRDNLVTGPIDTTLEDAKDVLHKSKVEKLLLVDKQYNLQGLITIKDINKLMEFPLSNLDPKGRLRAGAAVGATGDARERAAALVEQGADVLVVDTAHGHSRNVGRMVEHLKAHHDVDVIAGNVATAEGAKYLADAGADGVKVGIGPGSICTTRVIAGVGVPQLSAIAAAVGALRDRDVPVIADGGIRYSGDIVKALGAGAHCVMIGSLFAGTEESPGETVLFRGRTFKSYRGMGSLGAMAQGSKDRYGQDEIRATEKFVPEGVEGRVPYKGHLKDLVHQLVGGLRQGMGYCGARTVTDLRTKARFLRVSQAGVVENHPHDIEITKEAPNYRVER